MKTQAAIRAAFWRAHPMFDHLYRRGRRQNDYPTDVHVAWVDYVDRLSRDEEITAELAFTATL